MVGFEDFREGQLVAHISLGDGIVFQAGDTVKVVYVARNRSGDRIVGEYDRNWFNSNPTFLFHRSIPTEDEIAKFAKMWREARAAIAKAESSQ